MDELQRHSGGVRISLTKNEKKAHLESTHIHTRAFLPANGAKALRLNNVRNNRHDAFNPHGKGHGTAQRTTRSVCSSGVNEEKMASALPFPLPCTMPKQLFPGALRVFKQHTLHHTAKRCPPRARSDCQNIVAKSSARSMRIVCVNLCPPSHTQTTN